MSVGNRIKKRRQQLKMSAEQLAEKINVSPATIYRYENGSIANMGTDKLDIIAQALSIEPKFLMGWEELDDAPAAKPAFSNKALDLAAMFDSLDEHGQEIVLAVARIEFNRIDLECAAKGIDILDMINAKRLGTINGIPLYDGGDPAVAHAKYYSRAERSEMEAEESKTTQSHAAKET